MRNKPGHKTKDPFQRLVEVITQLRAKDGCPWDQKQTAESLKKYLLEESTELAEAIDKGDIEHIKEETGDLFFILILLSKIHEDGTSFTLDDVLSDITAKMIRRHPHVFGNSKTGTESELREQWQAIKAMEKS